MQNYGPALASESVLHNHLLVERLLLFLKIPCMIFLQALHVLFLGAWQSLEHGSHCRHCPTRKRKERGRTPGVGFTHHETS